MLRSGKKIALAVALTTLIVPAVTASAASAIEAPYYKVGGARLEKTNEVLIKANTNQVLKAGTITVTCKELAAKKGALIEGSVKGEPGKSSGTLEYGGCEVAGNGEKCVVTSVKGAKDKKVVTNALKDELVYLGKESKATELDGDLFTPATGAVFVTLKFEPETGGKCTTTETAVEGSFVAEVLNSKKEAVGKGKNEKEEEFGFIKNWAGQEYCQVKASVLQACKKASLKAFGLGASYEGTSQVELPGKTKFGVFGGGGSEEGQFSAGLDFGKVLVGSSSEKSAVLLDTLVSGTVTPGASVIKALSGGAFKVTSDGCNSVVLSYTQTCTIKVKFTPSAAGLATALLETPLTSSGGVKETAKDLLTGEGF